LANHKQTQIMTSVTANMSTSETWL